MKINTQSSPQTHRGIYILKGKNCNIEPIKTKLCNNRYYRKQGLYDFETLNLKTSKDPLANQKTVIATNEDTAILAAIRNVKNKEKKDKNVSVFSFKQVLGYLSKKKVKVIDALNAVYSSAFDKFNYVTGEIIKF